MPELSCVIHVHSRHSDGTGTVEQIAAAAERSGADVLIVTDHDSLGALEKGETGRRGDLLVLAGHEVSPRKRNHMLAFDTSELIDWKGRTPAQVAGAVRAAGGFGIAAHPFSRGSRRFRWMGSLGRSMSWEDLDSVDGIEVWNVLADHVQALGSVRDLIGFVRRPEPYMNGPPQRNLDEWDRLCSRRRVVGIGGLDAHQFGLRIGSFVVPVVPYERSFGQVRTHVLADTADEEGVFGALREGRCFISAHFVAPAHGFRFGASGPGGTVEMGAEAASDGWELRAGLPDVAEVRLLRDGAEVARATGDELLCAADGPGAYRIEARREHLGELRTWILSNPVYLR